MTRNKMLSLFAAPFVLMIGLLMAAPAEASKVYTESGVAIDGYDPVAYFTDGKPVEGDSAITFDWNGTTWQFANSANRDTFAADPDKYAPQYGGYCAYAVSQGYTAPTVPDAWKIVDGKLYLNYSKGVQQRWNQDIPGYIKAGDKNWPGIVGKL